MGPVIYCIKDEVTKKDFIKAMNEISTGTCIKFIPRRPHDKDYVFAKIGNQCSSKVGRTGGPQVLATSKELYIRNYLKKVTFFKSGFVNEP